MEINYKTMTDEDLNAFITNLYQDEATYFGLRVNEMFKMSTLREWFRKDFAIETNGMSKGLVKLAVIPLIEKGYLRSATSIN